MANRYATKSGNWSDVTVWDGGITLPGVGDVVRPNGYGVTVDQDITVDTLRNDAASPANAGGYFVVSSMPTGRKITANLVATGERLVSLAASNPTTLEIWGNVQGGSVTNAYGVRIMSAAPNNATVSIVGDVVGGLCCKRRRRDAGIRRNGNRNGRPNIWECRNCNSALY